MNARTKAIISLGHSDEFPFDASDAWWSDEDKTPPPYTHLWQYRAARGVIADLEDRAGIKHGFAGINEDVRREIVESLVAIIEAAFQERNN